MQYACTHMQQACAPIRTNTPHIYTEPKHISHCTKATVYITYLLKVGVKLVRGLRVRLIVWQWATNKEVAVGGVCKRDQKCLCRMLI